MSARDDLTPPVAAVADAPAPARWRSLLWPVLVVLILLISAGSSIVVMFMAKSDPSFAVEPDYYQQAVDWDERMAQERRSLALGWSSRTALTLDLRGDSGTITLALLDRTGAAVTEANVDVIALFNARAAVRYAVTATEQSPGCYVGRVVTPHPGEWELRIAARRGGEEFHATMRTSAARAIEGACGVRYGKAPA